jgi:WD40 repeat protein
MAALAPFRRGLVEELNELLADPRWLIGKLDNIGPAGLEADLLLSADPACQALATVVRQNANVLAPLDPPGSLAATIASRIPANNVPAAHVRERLLTTISGSHLQMITAPPDLPHPALSRVLIGRHKWVMALAVAPDGAWLAAGGDDAIVRIWDPTTGTNLHNLAGHTDAVEAFAVASGGAWLASASWDGEVRIWDTATGVNVNTLTADITAVLALAVAPHGTWLASAGHHHTVQIWDLAVDLTGNSPIGHTNRAN